MSEQWSKKDDVSFWGEKIPKCPVCGRLFRARLLENQIDFFPPEPCDDHEGAWDLAEEASNKAHRNESEFCVVCGDYITAGDGGGWTGRICKRCDN